MEYGNGVSNECNISDPPLWPNIQVNYQIQMLCQSNQQHLNIPADEVSKRVHQ